MYLILKNNKYKIKYCKNLFNRFKGFMFKKKINYVLCFPKCNSIHTFFMRENIDIIMTNKNNKVLYIYNNFKKNKIILPKKNVYYTYELPKNTNTYNINDTIKIENN